MARQKVHIRRSKYGRPFVAGGKRKKARNIIKWDVYGVYENRLDAENIAEDIRSAGEKVRVFKSRSAFGRWGVEIAER